VPVSQADHALGGAQPGDDLLARRADVGGLAAAPGRDAHVERDLLLFPRWSSSDDHREIRRSARLGPALSPVALWVSA
jgi:hypothetical protein